MKKRTVGKTIFIVIGSAIILNSFAAAMFSNFHTGIVLTFLLGSVVFAFAFACDKFRLPRAVKVVFCVALAVLFLLISVLYLYGSSSDVTYREDAVIVLGAGIRGEVPSAGLKSRLDAAIDYHKKNPEALIVVSGGRGVGEDITEALAMERYLVSGGVDPAVIIKEESATSTSENFRFSKEILDGILGEDYEIVYITSNFHVYRSGKIAENEGYREYSSIGTSGSAVMILPNGLREFLATIKFWVLKY